MATDKYTVVYEAGGIRRKLCKIWFGSDGSYYVTSPYHPAEKALLLKATVKYGSGSDDWAISFDEALDLASAEDDDKRIKLSPHPDGFVQFSGQGIVSGLDAQGQIRGVGVRSWPLNNPCRGPAFGLAIRGIEQFRLADADKISDEVCLFTEQLVVPGPGANLLVLEGHYFPALWRRFVQPGPNGTHSIDIVHPAGAVLHLRALFPPERCPAQGFLGVELYGDVGDPETPVPSFILSGSTGNLQCNEKGELLGDSIYCLYPRGAVRARRNVDFPPAR
jgi:hypothetical protein